MIDEASEGDVLRKTYENLRAEDIKLASAIIQDPFPAHFDLQFARELGHPSRINHGILNTSYLVQTVVENLCSPYDLESLNVRFIDQVYEGDTVTATAKVVQVADGESEHRVKFELHLEKNDGSTAVEGSATATYPSESNE